MKLCVSLLALVLAASMAVLPVQRAQADEQGWGLLIRSPHVGVIYLYVTNEGFAIVVKETGAKFVTHAPDWKLVMYNDKTQVYYVERLEDLQMTSNPKKRQELQQRAKLQTAKVGRTEVIAGLPATQYFMDTTSSEGGERQVEVWITKSISPPAQLLKTFKKLFNVDMSNGSFPRGLPLRIKLADEAGKKEIIYDTLKAQTQLIHTASFSYPRNYRPVDSEFAVLMDEKSRKKMESILDDSDDLSTLLGSTSTTGATRPGQPSRPGVNPTNPRPAVAPVQPRPANYRPPAAVPAAAAAKKNSGDWWSNMFNSLGK